MSLWEPLPFKLSAHYHSHWLMGLRSADESKCLSLTCECVINQFSDLANVPESNPNTSKDQ